MTREYDSKGRDQINIETVLGNLVIQNVAAATTQLLNPQSPYKGLKNFELEDSALFFGRNPFLRDLVSELEQTNLVLLMGASGSGKSSIIRAGLVSLLRQEWGRQFVNLTLTPDQDPFDSLYVSLRSSLNRSFTQEEAKIARKPSASTLNHVVKTLKQTDSFWLIFIDQFEELFTTTPLDNQKLFIEGLVQLKQQLDQGKNTNVKIAAAMRADFLDRLSPYPVFLRATNAHRPMVGEMQVDELRLAIEQPAAHHGVVFESGLVEQIVKDVQGQAGYLPLLQYTLDELWEHEVKADGLQERTLRSQTYQTLGGVRGALQKRVDQFYARLSRQEQQAVQQVFLKLVEIGRHEERGEDWKPVRRRALKSEFGELEQTVLMLLIDQNLLVSDRQPQAAATVEIAHEVLLTSWPTLNEWITANRQAISLRNRLYEDMARWEQSKADDELWSGSKLAKVLELKNDPAFIKVLGGFNQKASSFIDASQSLRERRRRRILSGLSGFTTVALASAVFAMCQWNLAEQRGLKILVTASKAQLENDQLSALYSAVKAGMQSRRFPNLLFTGESSRSIEESLKKAVDEVKERNRIKLGSTITSVGFSPDNAYIAARSTDGTINIWKSDGTVYQSGEFNALNTRFASNNLNKQFILFVDNKSDIRHVMRWSFDKRTPKLDSVAPIPSQLDRFRFSPNGEYLIAWNAGREIEILGTNARPGEFKKVIEFDRNLDIYDVDFSPDGQFIIAASKEREVSDGEQKTIVEIWMVRDLFNQNASQSRRQFFSKKYEDVIKEYENKNKIKDNSLQIKEVTSIAIKQSKKDGVVVLLGDARGKIIVWDFSWDLRRNKAVACSDEGRHRDCHTNSIADIQFNPQDSNSFATSSDDGTIKYWQIQESRDRFMHENLVTYKGHGRAVHSIAFNKMGDRLISGGEDKTVRLWQVETTDKEFSNPSKPLNELLKDGCNSLKDYLSNSKLSEDKQLCKEFY